MIGLTYIRNLYNQSLDDIGELLGVSRQTVFKWENGIRPIAKDRLSQLSEVFNLKQELFIKELTNEDKISILEQEVNRLKSV